MGVGVEIEVGVWEGMAYFNPLGWVLGGLVGGGGLEGESNRAGRSPAAISRHSI